MEDKSIEIKIDVCWILTIRLIYNDNKLLRIAVNHQIKIKIKLYISVNILKKKQYKWQIMNIYKEVHL